MAAWGAVVVARTSCPRLPKNSSPVMRWWTCAICEYSMTEDWFVGAVERVADAGRQACLAIENAVGALQEGREARNAGRSIVDVVDELIVAGGRETRLSAADAFREYERAIASLRAGVVRALVDEGGLSLTDVARRLKISRQATARLYEPVQERGDLGPDRSRT
jgi:hypothetical protein